MLTFWLFFQTQLLNSSLKSASLFLLWECFSISIFFNLLIIYLFWTGCPFWFQAVVSLSCWLSKMSRLDSVRESETLILRVEKKSQEGVEFSSWDWFANWLSLRLCPGKASLAIKTLKPFQTARRAYQNLTLFRAAYNFASHPFTPFKYIFTRWYDESLKKPRRGFFWRCLFLGRKGIKK